MFQATRPRATLFLLVILLGLNHPASNLSAQPAPTNAATETERTGSIVAVKGATLVFMPSEGVTVKQGDQFEILIDLPDGLGTATVATGTVTTVSDGLVMGKVESKDARAKLSTMMSVRFSAGKELPKPKTPKADDKSPSSNDSGFHKAVQRYRRGVLIVKDAKDSAHGTAFVISKKHRLLATNAHVADIAHRVVVNESRTVYKVTRRYYHPDTIRNLIYDPQTLIRSIDQRHGRVDARGTDLAILQLEMLGPELPAEIPLATPEEVKNTIGSEVGVFGFPGYNTRASQDQFAQATFIKGVISRFEVLLGHRLDQRVEDRRYVAYTAPTYGGFSGSPVFLSNGKGAIIHNSSRQLRDSSKIAYGIRVDALWDLLNHFNLADKIPGAPTQLAAPVFVQGQYTAATNLLKGVDIAVRAKQALDRRAYYLTLDLVAEAEKLAPTYWWIPFLRGEALFGLASDKSRRKSERAKDYVASLNAFLSADKLHLKSFNFHPVEAVLQIARQSINATRYTEDVQYINLAIDVLSDQKVTDFILTSEQSNRLWAAQFLALRACIRTDLGDAAGAVPDIDEAIRLRPGYACYIKERKRILSHLGRSVAKR